MINKKFSKFDLDMIKYYCTHFIGVEKALRFLKEFNTKINHLVSNDICDFSVLDFDYSHYNLDPDKIKKNFIPQKNLKKLEVILNNLYFKYSIDNEYFAPNGGFNPYHLVLREALELFYFSKVKKGNFISDLINFDFDNPEMQKKFLFNTLMFSIKKLNLSSGKKKVSFRKFCCHLGEKISKQCLELNFNQKSSKNQYLLELLELDFYDFYNDFKIKLFEKHFKNSTTNLTLINHINDYLLYDCFINKQDVILTKYSKKVNLSDLKKKLEQNLFNHYFILSKDFVDILISSKIFFFKNDQIFTKLDIISDQNSEFQLFEYEPFSIFLEKTTKYEIKKEKLLAFLLSLDNIRLNNIRSVTSDVKSKSDVIKYDSLFGTKMRSIENFFLRQKEKNNFKKLFRYSCDFSNNYSFQYDVFIETPVFEILYINQLIRFARTSLVKKSMVNSMLFKNIILLHFSYFMKPKNNFDFENFYLRIKKKSS